MAEIELEPGLCCCPSAVCEQGGAPAADSGQYDTSMFLKHLVDGSHGYNISVFLEYLAEGSHGYSVSVIQEKIAEGSHGYNISVFLE